MCSDLMAPDDYKNAPQDERERVSNGCGPQSALFDVVPDNLLGLYIGCACDVHDWMYEKGGAPSDRDMADLVFYWNMVRMINKAGGLLQLPRLILAKWYYHAVRRFGAAAFKVK